MLSVIAGVSGGQAREPRTRPAHQGLSGLLRSGRLPALFVVAGGLVLLYGFLFSGDYTVSSVIVHGAHLGDPAQVADASQAFGKPIFELDAEGAAQRIAALPYVERVTVETAFPDRVEITVIEREPAARWVATGRSFLVDSNGHVLAEATDASLPVVAVDGGPPSVGDRVEPDAVAAVVAVREALDTRLAELSLTDQGFVARLSNGRVVVLGDPERMPRKLAVLAVVLDGIDAWSILDLREPDRPYYK